MPSAEQKPEGSPYETPRSDPLPRLRGVGRLPHPRHDRMPHLCPPKAPLRPYPWKVTETPPPEPHRILPDAMRTVLSADEEGPVMVTTWIVTCEYIDENGAASVAAWASDDPHWRLNGLLTAAGDMLDVEEHDDEEIDDD